MCLHSNIGSLVTVSTLEYLITHLLPSGCRVAWLKSTPPGVELTELAELELEVDPDVRAKLDPMEELSEEEPDETPPKLDPDVELTRFDSGEELPKVDELPNEEEELGLE